MLRCLLAFGKATRIIHHKSMYVYIMEVYTCIYIYIHNIQALGTYKVQAFLLVLSKRLKLYIEHDNIRRTIPA